MNDSTPKNKKLNIEMHNDEIANDEVVNEAIVNEDCAVDQDWQSLQAEWQSYQPDIKKIKKKINWVSWRMGAVLVLDVVAVIAYFPFVFMVYSEDENNWMLNSWHFLLSGLLVYGVYVDFKIRLPLFRSQGDSTRDVLALYLKRVEAGVAIGRIGKLFSWLLLLLFILWVAGNAIWAPENTKITRWTFFLFGCGWISLIGAICIWYERKKRRELQQLKSLWKDYLE